MTTVPSMNAMAEPMIVAASTHGAEAGADHALGARWLSYVRHCLILPFFAAYRAGGRVRSAPISHPALFAPASYALSMNPSRVSRGEALLRTSS